jgi:hypothetical protein
VMFKVHVPIIFAHVNLTAVTGNEDPHGYYLFISPVSALFCRNCYPTDRKLDTKRLVKLFTQTYWVSRSLKEQGLCHLISKLKY